VNRRLRRRHRYLVALVAAGVLLAAFVVASRPLPDGRTAVLPAALRPAP
jgi:hypothetical protein